jgi:hypothetical protein
MTRKEAFEKIKTLLMGDEKEFGNAKLADGTIVQWEGELTEGTALLVVAEDGNTLPAPDAQHELEDSTLVTTLGGLVTVIQPKEKEEELAEVEVEVPPAMTEDVVQAVIDAIAPIVAEIKAIADEMKSGKQEYTKALEVAQSVEGKFEAIKSIVDEIAKAPEVESPKPIAGRFNIQVKDRKTTAELFAEYKKFKGQN